MSELIATTTYSPLRLRYKYLLLLCRHLQIPCVEDTRHQHHPTACKKCKKSPNYYLFHGFKDRKETVSRKTKYIL